MLDIIGKFIHVGTRAKGAMCTARYRREVREVWRRAQGATAPLDTVEKLGK